MKHLKTLIALTRLNKPIGVMLLFWPCAWGLAYAYNINQNTKTFVYYLLLFFIGSVLMRVTGGIFNDLVDKDLDILFERTKKRPIASGIISVRQSIFYIIILCLTAFIVLLQFNLLTIYLGMGSMLLAFTYPFMKRITYWPQLFLGLTFNWGLIMGWVAINNDLSFEIIIFYISAIFWTLGYDTIYGAQDMTDDEIIGIKSTSIKFKNNINLFIGCSYFLATALICFTFINEIGSNFFTLFLVLFILTLIYQVKSFDKKKLVNSLRLFKLNNISGLLLFIGILLVDL